MYKNVILLLAVTNWKISGNNFCIVFVHWMINQHFWHINLPPLDRCPSGRPPLRPHVTTPVTLWLFFLCKKPLYYYCVSGYHHSCQHTKTFACLSSHLTSVIITTLIIHHPIILPFQTQNFPISQILPSIDTWHLFGLISRIPGLQYGFFCFSFF